MPHHFTNNSGAHCNDSWPCRCRREQAAEWQMLVSSAAATALQTSSLSPSVGKSHPGSQQHSY